jgi:predicted nucleic acid-binding protein
LIVLDASAVLELLLRTRRGLHVQDRLSDHNVSIHVPHLLDLEVAQVLRKYCTLKALTPARAQLALSDLRALELVRYAHEPMLRRIWQLRENVTAYDAAYIALAESLDATLVTLDAKLARASGHAARVDVVS